MTPHARIVTFVPAAVLFALLLANTLAAEETEKSPVPAGAAAQEALKLVQEIYGGELTGAKTSDQKQTLARTLLRVASESQDSTNTYVLLDLARNLAVACGDRRTAYQAIEELDRQFQVDAPRLKASALFELAKAARSPADSKAIAGGALELADEAVARDDFDFASKLLDMALTAARRGRDANLVRSLTARKNQIEGIAVEYEQVKQAERQLEANPTDPAANLSVGRFRCVVSGDWEGGLLMLALGSDGELKRLAVLELEDVSDPTAQTELADAWWSHAEQETGLAKSRFQERAAHWYRKVLPTLGGLAKVKAAKRLEEVAAHPVAAATSPAKGLHAIDPAQWGVLCWNGSVWQPYPLTKMTAEVQNQALYVRNTTGIHKFAFVVYASTVFDGDFRLEAEVFGKIRHIGLTDAKGKDASASFRPATDQNWHTFTMRREDGHLVMTWDGTVVTTEYFESSSKLVGVFYILLLKDNGCAIRKFAFEKLESRDK